MAIRMMPKIVGCNPVCWPIAGGNQSLPVTMNCCTTNQKAGPKIAPWIEPRPPITTIISSSMDCRKPN